VRREWRELTRTDDPEALRKRGGAGPAPRAGHRVHLHPGPQRLLGRHQLRFPLLYNELIQGYAADRGLPLEWVYAVIRQESVFDADVASHAGAVG
jgi:soluble lytic murein transglycosylase-like protein